MLFWILVIAVFVVLPVVLRLFVTDDPGNGEPPDPGDEEGELPPLTAWQNGPREPAVGH